GSNRGRECHRYFHRGDEDAARNRRHPAGEARTLAGRARRVRPRRPALGGTGAARGGSVTVNPPQRATVYEVGPRDGLQNEAATIPTAAKVAFVEALIAAGLPIVEAAAFV